MKTSRRSTIGRLLGIGFALLIGLVGLLAALSAVSLERIRLSVERIAADHVPGIVLTNRTLAEALKLRLLIRDDLIAIDNAERKQIARQCDAQEVTIRQVFATYLNTKMCNEERELSKDVLPTLDAYVLIEHAIQGMTMNGKMAEAKALLNDGGHTAFAIFQSAVEALVTFNQHEAEADHETISNVMASDRRWTVVAAVSAVLLASGAGWYLTRRVSTTIRLVAGFLGHASRQVTSASSEVSNASQSLAERTSEQAASLEAISTSLSEISGMTRRNSESAQNAKTIAQETRSAAELGTRQMDAMIAGMSAIKASSDNISKIIKTIDEIAFQTNILALNASVEAARAGEAGLGFAVVADEVRNLAQRSAQAARETAERIADSICKSASGVELSSQVAASLRQITEKARQVDRLVAEIAAASVHQNRGIEQVNTAVALMDAATQSNAATAEEVAASSEELNAQTGAMHDSVEELASLVGEFDPTGPSETFVPDEVSVIARGFTPLAPKKLTDDGYTSLSAGEMMRRPASVPTPRANGRHPEATRQPA